MDDDDLLNFLTFNSIPFQQDFIEKLLELTQFVVKFYKLESQSKESLMDLDDQDEVDQKIERLLLMNINQNYTTVKSDFSQPLQLIFEYIKEAKEPSTLRRIGMDFVFKLSKGSVNLSQRVMSLKIILKLLKGADTQEAILASFISK